MYIDGLVEGGTLHASAQRLLPGQEAVLERLRRAAKAIPVVAVTGPCGMGRTTVLRRFAVEMGAEYIDLLSISRAIRQFPVFKSEEAVLDMVRRGLKKRGGIVFDGYTEYLASYSSGFAVRGLFFQAQMMGLINEARGAGHHIVLGGNVVGWHGGVKALFGEVAANVRCDPLSADDYEAFLRARFDGRVAKVDFGLLHALAPNLNLHQLMFLANRVENEQVIDFDILRGCIETEILSANLRIEEVEELHFDALPGSEHIARVLETHVVLPFEQPDLARELGLKPRRGVLLYGPPGTGKTSIGRALAHRMKGRFFLIDGSVITEPPAHFFHAIDAIVARAKANAPSVLFIDDADVLFGIGHVQGLSRYLLSLLDGVESRSASEVCIVLTAMDAAKLPAALLRSGRIELWLETRAPDRSIRERILDRWIPDDMKAGEALDLSRLADDTEGFTPADLRRLASDARLFYAADLAAGQLLRPAQHYLDLAVSDLGALRSVMDRRLGEEAQRRYYA